MGALLKKICSKLHQLSFNSWFALAPILCWAIYLRISYRVKLPLWKDEYWQIFGMDKPFLEWLKILPTREFCAYLSGDLYLTYPFYQLFHTNRFGLAIPHLIITLIGFALFYLLSKKYLKTND